ncbi:aspartate--tRNA(Asn) ligase [Burkholderia ubonensis]|uniref:aspartate--tRNA(Asn) ligase n=1 Tax=Burkholderia ubonensis TaxID=101571 RepID=UPI0007C785F5|nr:aspartate--tRNA(Asn) ligase [Burkholderia ubonensis]
MSTTTEPDVALRDERVLVDDLSKKVGKPVTLCGWLVGVKRVKSMRFVSVRDRTGTVQAVCRGDALAEEVDALTLESAIRVVGRVQKNPASHHGKFEIEVERITLLSPACTPLPWTDNPDPDARLDYRYLDLRKPERFLIFQVQTTLEAAIRDYLLERGHVEIHTPKITAGGSESGSAVFELPYFGERACLVQSPQFYMQLAMAAGFDRVFEVGPVFRAEAAVTNRHATEFTCIDVEVSWIDSHEELMALEEAVLRHALAAVRDAHGRAIERAFGVAIDMPDGPIPRVPLALANELMPDLEGEAGGRLTYRAEQALSKYAMERYGHSFVFVTDYPAADRPFYTMHAPGASDTIKGPRSRSFDLLWRGTEITSGCQREHRYERLRTQAAAGGIEADGLARYLDRYYFEMFKYGCPPHGGFGIGIGRLLMALLAQPSIRETSFVFRGPGRYVP